MDPDDPRSRHVIHFIDAVKAVRPRAFVMENVKALASQPRWDLVLSEVLRRAEKLGYETRVLLLDAADFGVPQHRERMFLFGINQAESANLDDIVAPEKGPHQSVRTALSSGQPWQDQEAWQRSTAAIVPARSPVLRTSPFAGMLFNGQGRPLNLELPAPTISASLGGNHTPIVDQRWLDEPEEGGTAIIRYHDSVKRSQSPAVPKNWRRLSLIEAARLQTFPRDVAWGTPLSARFRHVGNAVPPLLASGVASILRRTLDGASAPANLALHY